MRIAIVSHFNPASIVSWLYDGQDVPFIHSAATAVNTLCFSLLEMGHQLTIFTIHPNAKETKILTGPNVKVYLIPYNLWPTVPSCLNVNGLKSLGCSLYYLPLRIANEIEQELANIDVIHAHWTYEYASAILSFSKHKPCFVTVRDWAPLILSTRKTLISKIKWIQRLMVFRKVMSDSNVTFIANSRYTYQRIMNEYSEKDVPIIPNPIRKDLILCQKQDDKIKHQFISIAQSLGDPRKNIAPMLKAFSLYKEKHSDAQLHLVGNYNIHSGYYERWEKKCLLNGVILHGLLPHSEVISLMDSVSCLIHPSLEETFGNILLEAQSRCLPCIGGKKSGAVPYVLGDGKYGLVCNVNDPLDIFQSMEMLENEELASSIVKNATNRLNSTYASDIIAKQHIEIYRKKLSKYVTRVTDLAQ